MRGVVCGTVVKSRNPAIKEGDIVEFFEIEEVKQTL